jgi:site-specific recombinase XerD
MKLQSLIERYIAYRQALGESFQTNTIILRAFGRAIGARADIAAVRARKVRAFLDGTGPLTSAWHVRHNALLGFYRYAVTRGYVAASPLPTVLPQRPPPFVPHIYTQDELRRLLRATDSYQRKHSSMEPVTMRTLVLLLYGTGLRVHEAVALDRTDVDLENLLLTVRQTKFYKTRLVPFGPQLGTALAQYLARHPATPVFTEPAPFFTMRTGARVKRTTAERCFIRVRAHADVQRSDGASYQPRLHDLRHTFAVHRLTSWYRQGADVQTLLPQLAVYLGHVHLISTQVYLSMTPELLAEANGRFERYAGKEGGDD